MTEFPAGENRRSGTAAAEQTECGRPVAASTAILYVDRLSRVLPESALEARVYLPEMRKEAVG